LQMSWIGYVATSGLDAMDYFIGDTNLITPSEQPQFSEKILYLPAITTFAPYEPAPEQNELPALTNGYFTFCCLARVNKLNQPHIGLWARILKAVPGSRMILATMSNGAPPETVKAWFIAEGVAEERLLFLHARSVQEQLEQYRMADLSLDTFPYTEAQPPAMPYAWEFRPSLSAASSSPAAWGRRSRPMWVFQSSLRTTMKNLYRRPSRGHKTCNC